MAQRHSTPILTSLGYNRSGLMIESLFEMRFSLSESLRAGLCHYFRVGTGF